MNRVDEGRRGRNPADPRALILSHLIAEDSAYRDFLKRIVQKALNHQLTDAFLTERYEHYLQTAKQFQIPRLTYLPLLRQFLQRRGNFFRLISEQWLNTPASQRVTVVAPPGVQVVTRRRARKGWISGLVLPRCGIDGQHWRGAPSGIFRMANQRAVEVRTGGATVQSGSTDAARSGVQQPIGSRRACGCGVQRSEAHVARAARVASHPERPELDGVCSWGRVMWRRRKTARAHLDPTAIPDARPGSLVG